MAVILDALLALAFILTALAGLRNGFFRELFSIAGFVLGVWAGMRLTGLVMAELPETTFFRSELATAIVFLLIFIVVFAATVLAGGLLAVVWEGKTPGLASRFMGLGVGALRGLVLVLFLAGAMTLIAPLGSATLGQSRVLPYLSSGIDMGANFLPSDIGLRLRQQWAALPFGSQGREVEIQVLGSEVSRGDLSGVESSSARF